MEYKVVGYSDLTKVVDKVNELIKQGWKPQGGLSIDGSGIRAVFYQALVKEK